MLYSLGWRDRFFTQSYQSTTQGGLQHSKRIWRWWHLLWLHLALRGFNNSPSLRSIDYSFIFFLFPWQFNEWKFATNSGRIPPANVSLPIIFLSLGMLRTKAETGIAVETSRNTYESVNSPENTRILVYFHEGNAELARTITLTHQPGFNWIPAYNFQRPFWRYFNVTSTDDHHMPRK